MKKGKLFVLSAPSGSGKSTLLNQIIPANKNLEFSISVTTRAKRINETNGKDYFFIDKEEFINLIKDGKLLEWEEVYNGIFYGTIKSVIDDKLKLGINVVLDIDVKGAMNIKEIYKENCTLIFIKVKDISTLRQRLLSRNTDSKFQIEERLTKAETELEFESYFDYTVINEDLNYSIQQLSRILLTRK